MTTTEAPQPAAATHPDERRARTALALLATAQLMLVLDVTVVNVALPDIGTDLHLTSGAVPWVMTSYTVLFGGLMLLGGRLADLFGSRRTTMVGLALFTASSLACALSDNTTLLLAGRASQGIAAAVMSPAALATALSLFDEHGRAKALGVWSALAGLGSVLGVILGGLLTGAAGWRWIFAINLPIGVALLVALPLVVPAADAAAPVRKKTALDLPGAVLVTAGTGAAIYGLTRAGTHGWGAATTLLPLVGAVALWALFALVETRTRQPLLRLDLLTRRPVLAGAFLMLVATGLLVGSFFLGSFTLQHARGYGAVRVGLLFIPIAVAVGLGAHLAGRLLVLSNAKVVAAGGLALAAAGYGAAALWTASAVLVAGLSVGALGIGATFVTAFTAALTDVGDQERGLRSALVNTFHELGGAAGVAVLSSVVGTALVARGVTPDDFTGAFTTAALIAVGAVVVSLLVVPAVQASADAPMPGH
jgi:EmrB/QacA subfamily drug resistance transporter